MSKKSTSKKEKIGSVKDESTDTVISGNTPQRDKIKSPVSVIHRTDLTQKQKDFLKLAMNPNVSSIIVSGPAGTSKTFLSILSSIQLMNENRISDIVYVRSAVESADVGLGFLPGEKSDKMQPYIAPMLDKLHEILSPNDVKFLISDLRVVGIPVGYLRGRSWNAKSIVVDEAQNFTKKELMTTMTRVGKFTKIFILGDPTQSDIGQKKSGFKKVYDLFNDDESKKNGIYTFQFTEEDCVRSEFTKFVLKKFREIEDVIE